jgi:hypothetical protein
MSGNLRVEVAGELRSSWVTEQITEVARARSWTVDDASPLRPDAVVTIVALGTSVEPVDEPVIRVQVEAGTPRTPVVVESAPHLPARLELTVGAFRARRNQRVTRDAVERFLDRVEATRPAAPTAASPGPAADPGRSEAEAPHEPTEYVDRADAGTVVAQNRALIDQVTAWLARTSLTPAAAQAIGADRAILEAALDAPVLDLVIVERAAARLAAAVSR